MITIVQRVSEAKVAVAGELVGAIGPGLLALAAVVREDTGRDIEWTAAKLAALRVFRSDGKHFDKDVREIGGSILLVSNFTVAATTRQGRRPSLDRAAEPATAEPMFARLIEATRAQGVTVETGRFAADMLISLTNDGPATFILDSAALDLSSVAMSLPILSSHPVPGVADLIRLYYRTELHWARQLAEEEVVLDVGTALFNPAFSEVHDANMVFDASLADGAGPADAVAEADQFFGSRGRRCRMWVPNPSAPPERVEPLVELLVECGYQKSGYDIFHLASRPQGPIKEIGGLTIIPARASFRHARELAAQAAVEWGCAQLGDGLIAHLEDPQTDALLAIREGSVAGLVAVLTVGELGCIETLFITQSQRGTGIGKTLMSRALEICARALFKHVFIAVDPGNAPAVGLYRKLGFERIGAFVAYREASSSHAFT